MFPQDRFQVFFSQINFEFLTKLGGKSQPGCKKWDVVGMCDHGRSYEFYLESLQQERPRFLAFECESFDNLQSKNCTVVNELVQMGGEPGNK